MPDFADFSFWRLAAVSAHLNAGFARAADLKAGDVIDRNCRRGGLDRSRSGRGRAYERRSCRSGAALRNQAPRRRRWAVAAHRARPGGRSIWRAAMRRSACRFHSASRPPKQLRKVVVELAAEARAELGTPMCLRAQPRSLFAVEGRSHLLHCSAERGDVDWLMLKAGAPSWQRLDGSI